MRDVEIVEARSTESVATERSESTLVRSSAASHIDGNAEERSIVSAAAEIVGLHRAAGRKIRRRNQIRAIGSARTCSCLLHSGIYGKRGAGHQSRDIQELPSRGRGSSERTQETHSTERQHLDPADREDVRHVEGRWSFFCTRIPRILERSLQHDTCARNRAAHHRAGVIERFRIGVAGLDASAPARRVLGQAGLQCVVGRMGFTGNDANRAGAPNAISGGVELRERSKRRIGAGIAVRRRIRTEDEFPRYLHRQRSP